MHRWKQRILIIIAGAFFSCPALAELISSVPVDGTTISLPGGDSCFAGPSSGVVAGFPITATSHACYNYDNGWGFGTNGFWQWGFGIIGGNSRSTIIRIDLGGLYSAIGGIMNYSPGYGIPTISAIADDGVTILETYDLTNSGAFPVASVNEGLFQGISRMDADIRYFEFGGSYLALRSLTMSSMGRDLPEPSSFALLALALLFSMRIRQRIVK